MKVQLFIGRTGLWDCERFQGKQKVMLKNSKNLFLRQCTVRLSPSTSTFKFSSLGFNAWCSGRALRAAHSKVSNSLPCIALSSEEHGVGTGGGTHGQLIESKHFTSSLNNSSLGSLGDVQGSNGQICGNLDQAFIVSQGSHNDGNLSSSSALHHCS